MFGLLGINSFASCTVPPVTLVTDAYIADGTWVKPTAGTFWSPTGTQNACMVECTGGGGGGLTATGGGGGAANSWSPNIVPSGNVTVTIGTGAIDTNGGDTSFGTDVIATGGKSRTNGGTGATAASCTGVNKHAGGSGETGAGNTAGGGSGGNLTDGNTAFAGDITGAYGQNIGPGRQPGGGAGSTAAVGFAGGRGKCTVTTYQPATAGYARMVGRSPFRDSAVVTSRTPTLPGGVGGLLVVYVAANDIPAISMSGEWTAFSQINYSTSTNAIRIFYWFDTGGTPPSLTITTDIPGTTCGEVIRYLSPNGGAPGVPTYTAAEGVGTSADPPAHTPAGGSNKYLWVVIVGWDCSTLGSPGITALPTSFGNFVNIPPVGGQGSGTTVAYCDRLHENSTLNPGAYTNLTEQWIAVTMSIGPS